MYIYLYYATYVITYRISYIVCSNTKRHEKGRKRSLINK